MVVIVFVIDLRGLYLFVVDRVLQTGMSALQGFGR
jgi:hypothetical protein